MLKMIIIILFHKLKANTEALICKIVLLELLMKFIFVLASVIWYIFAPIVGLIQKYSRNCTT